jgi:nitroreductase
MLDSQYFAKGDIGAATAMLCLEAADLGVGSCIIGLFDRETICKLADIPLEKRIASLVALGDPADSGIREKIRKPLDEILRYASAS